MGTEKTPNQEQKKMLAEMERLELRERGRMDDMMELMLIFRSAVVDENYIPPYTFEYDEDLNKMKDLVRLNIEDIVGLRHTYKELNNAFLPEIVYRSDSVIKISRPQLIKILKIENRLRMASISHKRNDYFAGLRLMSEIDQVHIEEALEICGYWPRTDDSLKAYHLTCGQYINDPEIRELVIWMKYDKMRTTSVELNEPPVVDGIVLYDLNHQPFNLKDLIIPDLPNLIVCGSYS